jgi:hypothetical protein
MAGETQELRAGLLEAFQATDSATAWFLDRRKLRVVWVRRGVVSDPLLRARDVEDDEIRFVEIPAVTEAEVHVWMEEFVDEAAEPAVAACLDERAGANARFEQKLAALSPDALARWHRFRLERLRGVVDAWAGQVLAEHVPDGGGLAPG